MNKDYANDILGAIDLLVDARLKNLEYNKTVLCKVKSVDKAKENKYLVTDGATNFYAYYSEDEGVLKENDTVYVLVPNGDYNQQKIILGKEVTADSTPFVYVDPLKDYYATTNNLSSIEGENSILANNWNKTISEDSEKISQDFLNEHENFNILTYEDLKNYTWKDLGDCNLSGYDSNWPMLAISASFKTKLPQALNGDFGLKFIFNFGQDTVPISIYLNTSDMWGNPYDFESYYKFSKLINITGWKKIQGVKVILYQKANFHSTANIDSLIKYQYTGVDGTDKNILDNIFVKDIVMTYGTTALNEEQAIITCSQSSYYEASESKNISLVWNHIVDTNSERYTMVFINSMASLKEYAQDAVTITWSENINGVWQEIENKVYEYTNPELIPIIPDAFSIEYNPSGRTNTTQVRASIKYKNTETISNTIIFTNREDAESNINNALIQNVELNCLDEQNGVYRLYDSLTNELALKAEETVEREIQFEFDEFGVIKDNNDVPNFRINFIKWFIPKDNTMIIPVDTSNGTNIILDTITNPNYNIFIYNNPLITYEDKTNESTPYYHCSHKFKYKIEPRLMQSKNKNTIKCQISRSTGNNDEEGYLFYANKELSFGTIGSSSSNNLLVLSMGEETYIDENREEKVVQKANCWNYIRDRYTYRIKLKAQLYDASDKPINDNVSYSWSFLWGNQEYFFLDGVPGTTKEKYLYRRDNNYVAPSHYNHICVIRCQATRGDISYINYLPIPCNYKIQFVSLNGPDRVIYDVTGGSPSYYKSEYTFNNLIGEYVYPMQASILKYDNDDGDYINKPSLARLEIATQQEGTHNKFLLTPVNLYFKELNYNFYVRFQSSDNTVEWLQPLLFMQNDWTSSLSLGSIQHTQINDNTRINNLYWGIGNVEYFNQNNPSFTGLFMGTIGDNNDLPRQSGLYGYKQGTEIFNLNENGEWKLGINDEINNINSYIEYDTTSKKVKLNGVTLSNIKNGNNTINWTTQTVITDVQVSVASSETFKAYNASGELVQYTVPKTLGVTCTTKNITLLGSGTNGDNIIH